MLTFIEKLKVQQELSAKLATLKTNLGFIDKLTTQKAIAELLKKLSVDTKPPAKPTSEQKLWTINNKISTLSNQIEDKEKDLDDMDDPYSGWGTNEDKQALRNEIYNLKAQLKSLESQSRDMAEPENPLITELNQYLDVSAESILAKSLEDQAKYFESSRTRQREILLSLKESGDIKSNADSASIVMRKVIDHMIDIREKSLLSIEL